MSGPKWRATVEVVKEALDENGELHLSANAAALIIKLLESEVHMLETAQELIRDVRGLMSAVGIPNDG